MLQVNGSPTDAAAGLIKKGIHSAIDPSGLPLLAEYDTPDWEPSKAQDWVSGQISEFGPQIVGVVAANDGTGGGAIAAFKAAGVPVPPVTGNDAELAAAQRIIAGDQYNTISSRSRSSAEAAATVAYQFLKGERPGARPPCSTPPQLFTPTVVTKENLKEVLDRLRGDHTASRAAARAEYAAGPAAPRWRLHCARAVRRTQPTAPRCCACGASARASARSPR